LHYNKEQEQLMHKQTRENDIISSKFGYAAPSCEKKAHHSQLKRFQMPAHGDDLSQLYKLIQNNEQEHLDRLKSVQNELNKARHKQVAGSVSKAQHKKSEKAALQAWQVNNMPKDSM
jgi:hypothetical protein